MSARHELYRRVAGAFVSEERANGLLDAYRAEVLREAAEAVAKYTGNELDANAKMLRRMADGAAP